MVIGRLLDKVAAVRQQRSYRATRSPERVASIDPSSLLFHYGNIHSQRGQDGVLAEIFRRLGIAKGRFVEFGAWDGLYLCNSRWLYEKGWDGVFIEGVPKRYEKLKRVYARDDRITAIQAFVGAPSHGVEGETLSQILANASVDPASIDFVSIDVDGPDLEIFLEMGISPAVVLLEGGFNFTPYLRGPVVRKAGDPNLQHGLDHIAAQAAQAGYELVCFYQDSYLVRSSLFDRLELPRRTAVELYRDAINFMPQDYHAALIELRAHSPLIRSAEQAQFGTFKADPLDPAYSGELPHRDD